tara:strand:- start:6504 stop:6959 length:456 start_codon:yes stop_codon:yes gene_type:complete
MEAQIKNLFDSILTTINDYEQRTNIQISKHDTILSEKNKQIEILNDINEKQKSEMDDFLKVSYAKRWKNAAEEFEKKNIYLLEKLESLTNTNEKLNSKLDALTELVPKETQTDTFDENKEIKIKTQKGAIYTLVDGKLLGKDNKLVGEVFQ